MAMGAAASRRFSILTGAALAGALALSAAGPAGGQSSDIPWNGELVISRTSANDDIRNVLRSIVQANGLSAVFGPNVEGPISVQLDRVPIGSAFRQLTAQYGLDYSYDPTTQTVMITSRAGMQTAAQQEEVALPLDEEGFEQLSEALVSLGMGLEGVSYDGFVDRVIVTGDSDRVDRVLGLLTTMRPDLMMALAEMEEPGVGGVEAAAPAPPPPEPLRPPPPVEPMEVEVIQLRFADVGPSTRSFQGREVTVPGLAETLFTILGENEGREVGAPAQRDANMYVGPAYTPAPPPRISIDQRTNSVVVQGTRGQIENVRAIIERLDRPLQMVQIEVIIASADLNTSRELGVAFRGSLLDPGGTQSSVAFDTGVSSDADIGYSDTDRFTTDGLNALNLLPEGGSPATSFVVRGSEAALQARLAALVQDSRARILSAPRLVTLDNITARITRAQNIYVQVDTRLEGGGTGSVGLEEIQTGLTLEITPSIVPALSAADQGLVRLNLRAENSSPGSGVGGQIDVRAQEVQTNVLVPDGATFVIGGLFDDSQIRTQSGVPGLQDIPLIGGLFKDTSQQVQTNEVIFFITPRVITEQSVMQNDIAVRVGSQDYIERQRRALSAQYYGDVVDDSVIERLAAGTPDVVRLEEDE